MRLQRARASWKAGPGRLSGLAAFWIGFEGRWRRVVPLQRDLPIAVKAIGVLLAFCGLALGFYLFTFVYNF